jgi:hypothetical protein
VQCSKGSVTMKTTQMRRRNVTRKERGSVVAGAGSSEGARVGDAVEE